MELAHICVLFTEKPLSPPYSDPKCQFIPDEKISDVALVNSMLVRASGAIESVTTVPAVTAEDAVPQMRKAQEMAAAMAYKAPAQS